MGPKLGLKKVLKTFLGKNNILKSRRVRALEPRGQHFLPQTTMRGLGTALLRPFREITTKSVRSGSCILPRATRPRDHFRAVPLRFFGDATADGKLATTTVGKSTNIRFHESSVPRAWREELINQRGSPSHLP